MAKERLGADVRFMPHGPLSLVPPTLAILGLVASFVQDGCDYVKLTGQSVEDISSNDIIPYLEVGVVNGYRAPLYFADDRKWRTAYTSDCLKYGDDAIQKDIYWTLSKYSGLFSNIIGGSGAFFLCFVICFTYSIRTWRFIAFQLISASLLRAGTLLFLFTHICTQGDSHCSLYFGSSMDIAASVLWLMSATLICIHYPSPQLRALTEEQFVKQVADQTALVAKNQEDENMSHGAKRFLAPRVNSVSRDNDDRSYYPGDETVGSRSYYNGGQSVASQSYYAGDGQSVGSRSYFSGRFPLSRNN